MSRRWSVNLPTARMPFALFALLAAQALSGSGIAAQSTGRTDSTVTISGVVYDSLAGKPLADALVQLVAKGSQEKVWSATSDAEGAFHFTDVPVGSYIIGFLHPALDSLGLGMSPQPLEVALTTPDQVRLAIPSAMTIRNRICPPGSTPDSSGMLIGFVRDADTGAPLAGATVVVMWTELVVEHGVRTGRREVPAKATDSGWYALCGLPTDGPLTARAELGPDASGFIEISVPPHEMLHRDFGIPRGAATVPKPDSSAAVSDQPALRSGTARLSGIVRDEKGRPLSGAQVVVWGSAARGSTGNDGRFSFSGLPSGTQSLEARHVGYAPRRVAVDLVRDSTVSATVSLDQRADVLSEVTVYGKPSRRQSDFTGFLQRSKGGFGHFLTRADIEQRHPFQFTDLFRMIPGFMVVPDTGFGYRIVSTRGTGFSGKCQPTIYINGMRIYDASDIDGLVLPSDIAAVEAYAGPAGAPPQYTSDACGSILVWTGPDLGSTSN